MEKEDTPKFVGRVFPDEETNYYSTPVDAYGAKLTSSKFMQIKGETDGHKVIANKTVCFYDSGDSNIQVIRVKKEKAKFEQHQANIVDFIQAPDVGNEMFSLDKNRICMRWCYKFKDRLETSTVGGVTFDKGITNIESNYSQKNRVIVGWSSKVVLITYFLFDQQRGPTACTFYVPTQEYLSGNRNTQLEIQNDANYSLNDIKDVVFSTRDP